MNFLELHLEVSHQMSEVTYRMKNERVQYMIHGVAGLPDKKLFPSVSAVYGNTEVSMVYLGPPLDG